MDKSRHVEGDVRDKIFVVDTPTKNGPIVGPQLLQPIHDGLVHDTVTNARTPSRHTNQLVRQGLPGQLQQEITKRHGGNGRTQTTTTNVNLLLVEIVGILDFVNNVTLNMRNGVDEIVVESRMHTWLAFPQSLVDPSIETGTESGVSNESILVGFPFARCHAQIGNPVQERRTEPIRQDDRVVVRCDESLCIDGTSLLQTRFINPTIHGQIKMILQQRRQRLSDLFFSLLTTDYVSQGF
mmetsp:Transcript_17502/g.29699  ORF Transcript_17502/g.29699 Transcript_17502/m.29699 type:complete len:239 (-) Transcript_17502:284-1000(-)